MSLSGTQRIWLTGATSGIGRALAERLLADGHRVALSARGEADLEALAAGRDNALLLPLDVSDRAAVARAGERIAEAFGGLDLALLNAGTCEYLEAGRFDVDLVERVFAPNFHGAVYCIGAALPLLRRARAEGGRPLLAATSSAAAYLPLPRAEAYGASKAALSHFLEALRLDLHGEGIGVSLIHPGFVKTPLTDRNDFAMPLRIEADQAAEAILDGLARRRLDIHFPRRFTLLVKLMGILPPALRHRLGLRLVRTATTTETAP
ncbi:SDR family NAD(P)-dependent oxidoreductase [Halomonas sp. PGE1]|uniref:SDR family NAD(P)-dependent oxidoreductase n=1 Tax=Halomonas sp. PGE1 TaxID=2730360 RepID=UPI0014743D76|nr:SDR family NAD(P)-dependent oxidoreductase [Halomonas sp. PGE1]QJR00365.1 SDR family NAD(P)-dependent oxidoreductase [Halomonas sp. PGE1]